VVFQGVFVVRKLVGVMPGNLDRMPSVGYPAFLTPEEKRATICTAGQTFLFAISALFFLADRNVCPTMVRKASYG
jgi:hypothetical protein